MAERKNMASTLNIRYVACHLTYIIDDLTQNESTQLNYYDEPQFVCHIRQSLLRAFAILPRLRKPNDILNSNDPKSSSRTLRVRH